MADKLRGAMAVALLAALVFGLPVALLLLGAALKPFEFLGSSDLTSVLTRPDDGSLFLGALLVIAWAGWLAFSLSVVVEALAFVRRVPTPRLPGFRLPQHGAAALVATAALLVTSTSAILAVPVARPVPVSLTDVRARPQSLAPVAAVEAPARVGVPVAVATIMYPTVEVRRHDSLWSLAEAHLGSGERFKEIVELNLGRRQPDGRSLTDAHWVYPGWVLRLPVDAVVTSRSVPVNDETYTVVRGDTLSEIAADELGDGRRYVELFDLNEGRPQANGGSLSNPNEIRPGWHLALHPPVTEVLEPAATVPEPSRHAAPLPPIVRQPDSTGDVPPVTVVGPRPFPVAAKPTVAPAAANGHNDEAIPFGVGLGSIAATGLILELRRRRRLQQRGRRLGGRIAMPLGDPAVAEVMAAVVATPVTVDTVRNALRMLWVSCRAAGRELPDVLLVRVSPASLSLELRDEDAGVVPPFVADGDRRWRLEGPTADVASPDPYPALLTLGVDDDDLLLINLESVGQLRVAGPSPVVDEVLRAASVDLAMGPLSGGASLTFAGCFEELAQTLDPGRSRHVAEHGQALIELAVRLENTQQILAASGSKNVLAARSRQVACDATGVDIVVSRDPLEAGPSAWSGTCALALGLESADGWAIVVHDTSGATLQPMGLRFDPQRLSDEALGQVVSLLTTAQTPSESPAAVQNLDEAELVAQCLPDMPAPVLDLRDGVQAPPRVLVLGRVEVQRGDEGEGAPRRGRASELIAYLALHSGASGPEIDEALWPGKRVDKATRNPFISRARQWLGRSPEGEPYLPLVVDGGTYKLRPDVSCDWHDFVRFSKLGLDAGADGAMALSAALELVRGRPFLGVDPATYTWAEADAQEMISAVVDVAHVLSTVRFEAGDYRRAQEAAAKGLLAEPCSELLYRDALRAAVAAGDLDEVSRLTARLRHEITLLDPDETLDEETVDLLESANG